MDKETLHRIRLGAFVTVGLVMLITALYFIGSNKSLFSTTFQLNTTFQNIKGLKAGNNVRYSGIDVGTVEKIEIKNDSTVSVRLVIEEGVKKFIRKNSRTMIGTDGLMGNKLVNIDAGSPDSPVVNDGDVLASEKSVNTDAMMHTLEFTNQNIAVVSANLKDITDNIKGGRGTFYKVLMDTSMATSLHRTMDNMQVMSENLIQTTGQLSSIMNDIKKGKGMVGALLRDSGMTKDLQTIISKVKESSEKLSMLTSDAGVVAALMRKGDGTVAALVNDSAMANHLKQSMLNLQSSTQKLDENLEAMKHTFPLKGYYRKQEKLKKKKK